jgi:hypothetical protein
MPEARTKLAVHIAAGAIMYWFGGSLNRALSFIDPQTLHPMWYEVADYIIAATRGGGNLPSPPPEVH